MFGIPKSLYFIPLDAISFSSCDPCHWVSQSVIHNFRWKMLSTKLCELIQVFIYQCLLFVHFYPIIGPARLSKRSFTCLKLRLFPRRMWTGCAVSHQLKQTRPGGQKVQESFQSKASQLWRATKSSTHHGNSDKIEKTNPMCFSLRSWGHLVENFLNFCNFYGRKNNSYLLRSSEVQKAKNSNIPHNLVKWETGQTCFQIINLNIVTLLHRMLFLLCSLMLIAGCNNR